MNKRQQGNLPADVPPLRSGEGDPVSIKVTNQVLVNGQTLATLEIDTSNATVPDRRYVADYVSYKREHGRVRLLFGQSKVGSSDLRSLIVIQMSVNAMIRFLHTIAQIKNPSFDDLVARLNLPASKSENLQVEPSQTIELLANIILTAISGDESCLDFYQMSPFSVRSAQHHHRTAIEGVVRIDLPSSKLFSLVHDLRTVFPVNATDDN